MESAGCVLVVEDDVPIRRLLATALSRAGLAVASARDGAEGIETLQKQAYTVLLLDLMMPRMSGWDVLAWLEAHPAHRPRTVIVLSAGKADTIDSLSPAAVNAVIFKPFDLHALTAYVKSCCSAEFDKDRRMKRLIGTKSTSRTPDDSPEKSSVDTEHP